MKSFTLIELLLIVGILIILVGLAIPAFRFFQKETDLNNSTEEIINTLRLAQNKTLASEGDSQWGVYFSTTSVPNQYILFKGVNFVSRATSSDESHNLPSSVEISEINLTGGFPNVIFDRVTGATNQPGEISLRLKDDILKFRLISIQPSGKITSGQETLPSDIERIKDSRHVHFDYSRIISTSTESLISIFTYNASFVTKEIVISQNMERDQIYWEGEVEVGGSSQKLKIHTHKLNNPDTRFSIHRDRRYNDKALKIEISGDTSGDLIRYNAEGQTTKGNSIYVSDPIWQ